MNEWPKYSKEELAAVSSVLQSGRVNYWTGNQCRDFEKEFAAWSDAKYAVALSNGTLALDLALKAINVSYGDEIIVTSRTFIATVSCIINAGATPVFVDVERNSGNISAEKIRHAISPNSKAIICVHLAGWPCDMDGIIELSNKYNLHLIEDCAQAHGAKFKGKSVGSFGDIGCWSFCQDKIMTTGGEGGMVTTSNKNLWLKMWEYKDHGKSYDAVYNKKHSSGFRWVHNSFGSNFRMTEMQATIGRIQLRRMNEWHTKRLDNVYKIWKFAKECNGLCVPEVPDYIEHAAYKCYVFVKPSQLKDGWSRDRIIQEINALGVPCNSGSCSEVYLEKAFDGNGFRPKERLPNAKELGETSLMFLVHPSLTEDEIQQTCDAITSVMKLAVKS